MTADAASPVADSSSAADKAEELGDSAALELLARLGLVAYGLVHVLIGWTALAIAWGRSPSAAADTSGAMKTLAAQPLGQVLLGLVAIGLVALALWQVTESIWGFRDRTGAKRTRKRLASAGKSAFYGALGVSAATVALGGGASSARAQQERTSGVLSWPGGQTIVVVAALVIIGIGVAHLRRGVVKSFRKEIDCTTMSAQALAGLTRLGQVGYIAKGIALAVVGGLVGYAAWTFDPEKSRGLDGALRTILEQPSGNVLLTAVALGLMAFGLFAIAQSKCRRM
jgi:hypothetical protein